MRIQLVVVLVVATVKRLILVSKQIENSTTNISNSSRSEEGEMGCIETGLYPYRQGGANWKQQQQQAAANRCARSSSEQKQQQQRRETEAAIKTSKSNNNNK